MKQASTASSPEQCKSGSVVANRSPEPVWPNQQAQRRSSRSPALPRCPINVNNGTMLKPKPQSLQVALLVLMVSACCPAQGTQSANYDESKVGSYALPDPLVFNDGKPVRNAKDWQKRRRELLELFETNVYGHSSKPPRNI